MNPLQKLRYKTRVGMLLGVLLLGLLLNNIAGHASFNQIEKTAKSIYEDRLLPATFIFELREHLDRQQALFTSHRQDVEVLRQQRLHQMAIADLVTRYEQTKLTTEERREWKSFKQHLSRFLLIRDRTEGFDTHFEAALKSLNHLSMIQAAEGGRLQADMNSIANISSILPYLEIVLIIILGGLTLSLIGFSKNIFEQSLPRNPSLN
jgi:hypothetical protein